MIALAIVFTLAYRSLLSWDTLLAVLVLVILFIPIQRYVLPGALPFELEPYRLFVAFIVAGWTASLLVDPRVRLRRTGLELPVGLIIVSVLGSIVANAGRVAEREPEVVKGVTFLLSFFLLLFLIASVVRTMEQVDRLLRVLVGGGAVLAALAILESRDAVQPVSTTSLAMIPLLEPGDFYGRVVGGGTRRPRLRVGAAPDRARGRARDADAAGRLPRAPVGPHGSGGSRPALLGLGSLATLSRTSVLMLLAVARRLPLAPAEADEAPLAAPAPGRPRRPHRHPGDDRDAQGRLLP